MIKKNSPFSADYNESPADRLSSYALQCRYKALFRDATLPQFTLKEIEIAFRMFERKEQYLFGDPHRLLFDRCADVRTDEVVSWDMLKFFYKSNGMDHDPEEEFDPAPYDDLYEKFAAWTKLQCVKFIEVMQEFFRSNLFYLDVTPSTVHAFLNAMNEKNQKINKDIDWQDPGNLRRNKNLHS